MSIKRLTTRVGSLLAMSALLAACSSAPPSGNGSAGALQTSGGQPAGSTPVAVASVAGVSDPCALLTAAEVQDAFGHPATQAP